MLAWTNYGIKNDDDDDNMKEMPWRNRNIT